MKPDGFLNLIQGVINIGQDAKGSKSNDDKKRYTIIATVVSNPIFPDSKYQDLDKFYECVCAQVLSLLKRSQVKSVFVYLYNRKDQWNNHLYDLYSCRYSVIGS